MAKITYAQLCLLAQQGNQQAAQELIIRYDKYISREAEYWTERCGSSTLDYNDFKQLACIGFLNAIQHYKGDKGMTLLVYARFYIRREIKSAVANSGFGVKISHNLADDINKMLKTMNEITLERPVKGIEDLLALASERMQIPYDRAIEMYKLYIRLMKMENIDVIDEEQPDCKYKNKQNSSGASKDIDDLLDDIMETARRQDIYRMLDTLTDREKKILIMRFGLESGEALTLDELARKFGVTRDRIRQIEAKALRKLRHPSRSQVLEGYLYEVRQ